MLKFEITVQTQNSAGSSIFFYVITQVINLIKPFEWFNVKTIYFYGHVELISRLVSELINAQKRIETIHIKTNALIYLG